MKKVLLSVGILLLTFQLVSSQEFGYSVRLKLKSTTDKNYLATEDDLMKALSLRYDVRFKQSYKSFKTTELLSYYDLTRKEEMCMESWKNVIKEFLATGKFEDEVYEYGLSYINSCANPVSVNDPDFVYSGVWPLGSGGWPLKLIQAPCAWTITKGSSSVLIGIVDGEFRTTHEELKYKIASIVGPSSIGSPHGTQVASIAAGDTNNGKGIASVGYNSKIAAHRVVHQSGPTGVSADDMEIKDAITYLCESGIRIINVSWSGTGLSQSGAAYITALGSTLVLSGGNTIASNNHSVIADVPGVIVVSGVDRNNMHGPTYYARNQYIDICAPAKEIWTASGMIDDYYVESEGTSIAAPFVSGTIALMLSVNPTLTPSQIEQIIKSTADPIADGHLFPGQLGAGRLNAYTAVSLAKAAISGPSVICKGCPTTFSVNAPSGFTWSCSSNLSLSSTTNSSISVTGQSAGPGWVRINAGSTMLVQHNVTVPSATISTFSGSTYIGYQEEFNVSLISCTIPSGNNYSWSVTPSGFSTIYPFGTNHSYANISFSQGGVYLVTTQVSTSCGQTESANLFVNVQPYKGGESSKIVYPNPVDDVLFVDLDQLSDASSNSRVTYDLRLYDGWGNLTNKATAKGGVVQLNVSNLSDGMYFLHILDGVSAKPDIFKVIVKH